VGNRGKGGRETGKTPKPQKRMKTLPNLIFKMRKSKSPAHTTQPSTHSTQSPTAGRASKQEEIHGST
jgi:hypothetical protein